MLASPGAGEFAIHRAHLGFRLIRSCGLQLTPGRVAHNSAFGGPTLVRLVLGIRWATLTSIMRYILRFLWNATRGYHLTPWRSPYLRWRIETYTGIKMHSIGFLEFWGFSWRERGELLRFLKWTAEMERYARVKPKNP